MFQSSNHEIRESGKSAVGPESAQSKSGLHQWPPEEISRVRSVLRKVSAQRVRNPHDAEDLVQETFLTMTEKFHKAHLGKGLLVWGMAILRRKVGNYYRRENRSVPLEEWMLCGRSAACLCSPTWSEAEVHSEEILALVHVLLDGMDPSESVVLRKIVAGCSVGEIALMHHPEAYQNIVNRVHRGRRKLSKKLKRFGYVVQMPRESHRRA